MKNKLFIIAAMLITGMNGVFAEGDTPLSSDDMTFSIPSMTTIEVDSSSVVSTTAMRANANATSVTLSSPLTVIYNVSTLDQDGINVALKGTAPVDVNSNFVQNNIHYGYIVFTKSDGSTTLNAAANTFSPRVAASPNAIAFPINCTQADIYLSGMDYSNNYISEVYSITGEKEISCTVGPESKSSSFGMNDTPGQYTATLTLTQVDVYDHYGCE